MDIQIYLKKQYFVIGIKQNYVRYNKVIIINSIIYVVTDTF